MTVGGTLAHNTITLNLATALRAGLRSSSCRVFASDVKVVSPRSGEVAYPDVVVACQQILPAEDRITEPNRPSAIALDPVAAILPSDRPPTPSEFVSSHDNRRDLTRVEDSGSVALVEIGCAVTPMRFTRMRVARVTRLGDELISFASPAKSIDVSHHLRNRGAVSKVDRWWRMRAQPQ